MKKCFLIIFLLNFQTLLPSSRTPLRDITTTSRQAEPDDELSGYSLFEHPIIRRTETLLQNPLNRSAVQQVLTSIDPDILVKRNRDLHEITTPQRFALHLLIEKLLKRCDNIITNPYFNFLKPKGFTPLRYLSAAYQQRQLAYPLLNKIIKKHPQNEDSIELKQFEDLKNNKNKYAFAKLYRFFCKVQSDAHSYPGYFNIPSNFDMIKYMESSEFDYFFESDYQRVITPEQNTTRPFKVNLTLKNLLYYLAHHADFIERQSPQQPTA